MTRVLGGLLALALTLVLLVGMGFAGAYQYLAPEIPDAAALRDVKTQLPLRVYSRDGRLIAQIGEQRRIPVTFEQIPATVIEAFLAAEDARFYQHPGVDWQGLVRALVANVSAGGVREGGGTITMQLARNTVLTSERTLRRKLKEVFLALRLEREFSKQEILALYLNRIFLGQRAYGIGAAAEVYFDKTVADLTLAEAALIAGLPRSPSLDNPVASVERAIQRRAYVLRRMLELGRIDAAAHDAANAEPISRRIHGPIIELEAPYVAEMTRAEMIRQHGADALTAGYQVYTTVDSRLQQAANAAAWRTILEYERRHGYRGPLERIDPAGLDDATTLAAVFKRHPRQGSLLPAIVRAVGERDARLALRDGSVAMLAWDELAWARPVINAAKDAMGPYPKSAGEVLALGDVVYLEPLPDGKFRLGQLPAVSGALVSHRPGRRRDRGAGRRFRLWRKQVQPGDAGAAAAGVGVQAVPVFGRARARLHAGNTGQRRAHRAARWRWRRRRRGVAAAEHHAQVLRADAHAGRARALAQPGLDPAAARGRHRLCDAAHGGVRFRAADAARQPDPGARHRPGDAAGNGAWLCRLRQRWRTGGPVFHRPRPGRRGGRHLQGSAGRGLPAVRHDGDRR